ncbi:hypothetical protein IFU23_13995 [Pantoea agglomerans]|uniref:hypothetical protein n=1 Tax=Enterobacter agglomerans TaxID=549 RepID=UPI001785F4F0|nr:hypothetical protein [Pantoea agglomerans]MBD8159212.1 hypothetical protein [Pantoea agglomerans]MBD8230294.1 hypothetical protein [Pantoea agglomerans]
MTAIFDFNFEDGQDLAAYKLTLADEVPTDAKIVSNFLNVIAGEVHFHTGLDAGTPVRLTLKNACGDAVVNDEHINNKQTKDTTLVLSIESGGLIYLNVQGDPGSEIVKFKFSGYSLSKF